MTYLFNDIQKVSKDENNNTTTNRIYVDANVSNTVVTQPDVSVGNFYGEPYGIPITPVVQLDGRYGISSTDTQSYAYSGGTITSSNGTFIVSSTSATGSYAMLRSRRFNTYKAGQSQLARWYGQFSEAVLGTQQRMGIHNQENGFWFGYDGTKFGFLHSHGGRADIHRITITSYSGAQTITLTLNGVHYTINLVVGETTHQAAQRIALHDFNGAWLANQRDNTVELLNTSVAPLAGAFTITSSGTFSGSITQLQAGVSATDEWIYAGITTDGNGNLLFPALPAWFDPTYYHQYQMKYNWAGVDFFVLNPTTGRFELLFAHKQTDETNLELTNPAFKIALLAYNTGGNVPITVKAATMMSALEGITNRNNYTSAAAVTKASIQSNTLTQLLSIQNPYTFNNTINTKELLLQDLSVATQCNDPGQIYIYIDTPLASGIEDFVSHDGQPVTVSYADGTITTGTQFPIVSFVVGNTGSVTQFNLEPYRVVIPPGATVTIAIVAGASIQKAAASIVWYND